MNSSDNLQWLNRWADLTRREIQELTAAMLPLQERLEVAREQLDLIGRLIGLAEAHGAETGSSRGDSSPSADHGTGTMPPLPAVVQGADLEDRLEAILRQQGAPVHIKNIRKLLIAQGVPLPGRGDEANIILRLRRSDERFVRTGRGLYGLRSWGLSEVKAVRTRRRTRTKSGSTSR